jgi:cytochrome c oxidase assembly factor CtaG
MDTSLWPVVVGGLLALGGTVAGAIATTIRDAGQQRHETRKRRADKFEELVAAVYEFDHWLDDMRERDAFGVGDTRNTVSPFAKVQSFRPFISHSSAN